MDISRSLSVCMCVWEGERARGCAIRIRERNRSQRAKRLPGSEEIRWLKLRLVSIFFLSLSSSLSLFYFVLFSSSFSLIFGGAGSALNDSKRWMEVEKERKRQLKRGGRTISKGSKKVFPVVK